MKLPSIDNLYNLSYFWHIIIAVCLFILMIVLINKYRHSKSNKPITIGEARRIAESEIIKKGLNLHDVKIIDPMSEEWQGNKYWSVKYADFNNEKGEIVLSEYGDILKEDTTKQKAMELAKQEFERRGVDLVRVQLDEDSAKLRGRDYWIVRYTTSFGYSDKLLITKKRGIITY